MWTPYFLTSRISPEQFGHLSMPNIRRHWTKLFAPDYQQLVGVNYFQLKPVVAVLRPHQFYDVAWDGQKDSLAVLHQQQQQQQLLLLLLLIVGCKIGNAGRIR